MPWNEHILLLKFFLAHALVPVLICPDCYQSLPSYLGDPNHLFDRFQANGVRRKVMDDSNRDKGITSLVSDWQLERVSCKKLILFGFLLGCFQKSFATISPNHNEFGIGS